MTEFKNHNSKLKIILKAVLFCILFIGIFIALSFLKTYIPGRFERLAHGIIGTIAALLTTYLFIKYDRKTFADIGLKIERATVKKIFAGVLIGIAIMGFMALCVILFSRFKIEINKNSDILSFFLWTLPFIPLAFMEEMAFRAYPLRIIQDKSGVRIAIIITSILFALYHIVNGWTVIDAFLGTGSWGIIYGVAAVYSNGISMPTGLHYAANLTTAAVGITDTSLNIWTITQKDGSTLENYQGGQSITLILQICFFIFAVICMEWVLRKKKYHPHSKA